jgi:hypothetical protein
VERNWFWFILRCLLGSLEKWWLSEDSLSWDRSWPRGRRNMKQTAVHSTTVFSLRLLLITPDMCLSFMNVGQRNIPIRVYRNNGLFHTKILIKMSIIQSTKQWFLRVNSYSRYVLPFMEAEGSLSFSQQPVNGPHHKPVTSSVHPPSHYPFQIHFLLILPFMFVPPNLSHH